MSVFYSDDLVTLHHGDAEACAAEMTPGSVQTIVTSPPYFGLRDYGVDGQIGAEESITEYVDRLVSLFRVLRGVLADDGTLWLNLGDSYVSSPPGNRPGEMSTSSLTNPGRQNSVNRGNRDKTGLGLPAKNLIGVPWEVAFALRADGWILRSDIIWAKPNPMPESVTDRPTKAHEYVFLFSKSPRYYYNADAIAEQAAGNQSAAALSFVRNSKSPLVPGHRNTQHRLDRKGPDLESGARNKRTVWTVPTVPFSEAHFAVYPPELIRPCILAGSKPGDTVLDPFSGSGTTGMVATQEGRKYIGIDLNAEYLNLSLRTRFAQPVLNLADEGPRAAGWSS